MSSVLSWDPAALRNPGHPWNPLHHVSIKQEPLDTTMNVPFGRVEGFHSASPSSSSRDSNQHSPRSDSSTSPHNQSATSKFRPLTPPGIEASPDNIRAALNKGLQNAVTPPKTLSPSPPNSEGAPSPGDSGHDLDDDPGVRVPAVNSHGKVKTFRCKQCDFFAVTKMDFWEHTKVHIKPERMLNCPKCPFVTEYKHHLEYHMRNHFGSKPFQCKQCSYTCVNKSMLSSHLKSHSNIYQYRCADCNYATKYCHSLKLHARKYHHQAAMVLNPDGTPNPLPIIDVYGTRRGPKQKNHSKHAQHHEENAMNHQPQQQQQQQPPRALFPNPFNFPYGPLLQHPMLFPHNNNLNEPSLLGKVLDGNGMTGMDGEVSLPMNGIQPVPPHLLLQQRFLEASAAFSPLGKAPSPRESLSPRASPYSPNRPNRGSPRSSPGAPNLDALDLTNGKQELQQIAPSTPTTGLKNRRKGRAFKLERPVAPPEDDDNQPMESSSDIPSLTENPSEEIEVTVDLPKYDPYDSDREKAAASPDQKGHRPQPANESSKENFACTYCDIVFKDIIMYTMHMGYHGFNDPFTCNMCGHKSTDRVSFFVHIARSKHS